MSWYRTGTVAVTNGSKTVTGVGTLWASSVNAGDAFALVDANLNPTGAWYEVETVTSNTAIVLKQSYAGTTGSNKQYCVFNLVGNMTTPSFAQRLAQFFDQFQDLVDLPTTTPTASSIPIADGSGKIDSAWIKDATDSVKGVVELATSAETVTASSTTHAVTPAGFIAGLRGNLLGTVSQSGGIPTGAVIERGSNANGRYVKFADGTMICTGLYTGAITGVGALGALYTCTFSRTFPATFSVVDCVGISGNNSNSIGWGSARIPLSTTTTGNFQLFYLVGGDAASSALQWFAIGRWF